MSRLVVANFDYEDELARAAGLRVPPPSAALRERLAALASQLSVFDGPGEGLLAWGESAAVAALRPGACPGDVGLDDWQEALWRLWPAAEVAAACNHRGFAFGLAERLGAGLPGACMVGSVAELEARLPAAGTWVAKAPYSASGRHRLRHRGPPDAAARTRLERLLAGGALLLEPWVDRIADVGTVGLIAGPGRVRLFPPHRLENDPAGVYRGVVVDDAGVGAWLADGEREVIERTAAAAATALAEAGYRGPFGVDAFLWRDAGGARRLQPLCEINARLSFGLVARATPARSC